MKNPNLTKPIHSSSLRRALLFIAPALIIAALLPASSIATPSCDVVSENLLGPVPAGYFPAGSLNLMCIDGRNWHLITRVKGDSDLYVTKHTFHAGGQTGWHSHPGPSLITVIEGTLTVYHDDCTFETFSAGESFTDLGCGDIHNVRNEGATDAIDVAVQIVPHGAGRRDDKPDPGCAQVPPCPAF